MASTVDLVVTAKPRGLRLVRLTAALSRVLPRRLWFPLARWAVCRVSADISHGNAHYRRPLGLDLVTRHGGEEVL